MPKGSQPAGNITKTETNPLQVAQQPFLTDIWGTAQNQYKAQPWQYYPGQTLTQAGVPERTSGYQGLYNTAASYDQTLRPQTNAAYQTAIGGGYGVQNSPAYGGFQQFAQGTTQPQQDLYGLQQTALGQGQQYANTIAGYAPQQQAAGAQGGALGQQYAQQLASLAGQGAGYGSQYGQQIGQYADPAYAYGAIGAMNNNGALNSLLNTAQGGMLNSNPYLDEAIRAAQDPTQRAYQTSIAPSTDAMFSGGGRYGSGAMRGAVDSGQQNLVRGLGDISTNMSNANYARERQLMDQAAQSYGQLYNQGLGLGISGATAAGNLQQQAGNMALAGNSQGLSGLNSAGNMALSGNAQAMTGLGQAAGTQQAAGSQYGNYLTQAQDAIRQLMGGQQYGVTGLQGGYTSGNEAALRAMGYAPSIANLQFAGPQAQIQAGQGLGQIDQATLDDLRRRFEGQQQAPWTGLSNYQQAIGTPQGGTGTSSQPYFQNQFADALSGVAGVAGIGKMLGLFGSGGLLFSDRRLKEDDKVVGRIGDLPIHQFRYKGDDQQRIGFMADEVEQIDKSAVVDTDSGYKAVHYDRALGSALNSFLKKAA